MFTNVKSTSQYNENLTQSDELHLFVVGYDDFTQVKPSFNARKNNYYTLHYVLSGKGTLIVNDKQYNVTAGQFFFTYLDVSVKYYPSEDNPWKYAWFSMLGSKVEYFAKTMGFSTDNPVLSCSNTVYVEKVFYSLFNVKKTSTELFFDSLSAFYSIFKLLTASELKSNEINVLSIVEKVKEIINLNHKNADFNVSLISLMLSISHSYLCKLFVKYQGQTMVNYLLNVRLTSAGELAKLGNMSVKAIASAVGFNDVYYFMKAFKKRYGVSVRNYKGKL